MEVPPLAATFGQVYAGGASGGWRRWCRRCWSSWFVRVATALHGHGRQRRANVPDRLPDAVPGRPSRAVSHQHGCPRAMQTVDRAVPDLRWRRTGGGHGALAWALSTTRRCSSKRVELCHTGSMTTDTVARSYKGFRFPQEIIAHAVWLYFRFNLSY